MEALTIVEEEVRDQIRLRGLDPQDHRADLEDLVESAVVEYDRRSMTTSLPLIGEAEKAVKHVLDSVAGFGELQPLLDDETVEEIWINSPQAIFVARHGRSELTSITLSEERIRDLVERMLKSSGRRVDLSMP